MKILCSFVTVVLLSVSVFAQNASLRSKQFNLEKGLAIQGYDPVSYFQGKPLHGSKDHAVNYQGTVYYFASAANAEAFKKILPPMNRNTAAGALMPWALRVKK